MKTIATLALLTLAMPLMGQTKHSVKLDWPAVKAGDDPVFYNVMVGPDKQVIGITYALTFTDTDVATGTYHYEVDAVDDTTGEVLSEKDIVVIVP